ncbi:Proton-dependent oligopeptide transporter family [Macleaya cordata]|uniref:Proton-dependent oligopeptide transporter family n=1 Tax=Macleaya cordata TaxID=56857 RepID=A0A200R0T3_MACCD|nr:Proton-dependent oligopeptide transporter family [Macleaya cordata]
MVGGGKVGVDDDGGGGGSGQWMGRHPLGESLEQEDGLEDVFSTACHIIFTLDEYICIGEGFKNKLDVLPTQHTTFKGEKVSNRSKFGGWRSAYLIIGVGIAETIAYYGISSNLITYLTDGPLRQSTVAAAANVNAWVGAIWMLTLVGAFVADSFLGRFRTILLASLIYLMGLGLLTLSVVLLSFISPPSFQAIIIFTSLYLIAIGKAGFKPCIQAFGADQFDGQNPKECKSKSSFFNWWNFGLSNGSIISYLVLIYIEDNLGWGLGFGIPCILIAVALIIFLLGMKTYRYSMKEDKENPVLSIARVFVLAAKNWKSTSSSNTFQELGASGMSHHIRVSDHRFKFLDKALIDISTDPKESRKNGISCSISQVEDAKTVVSLVPIWITCLIYGIVVAQSLTFFTKQGNTMDRSIGPSFQIPAGSLQTFISLSVILFIPVYDLVFVPLARAFTGKTNGITMLQRIGSGIFLSIISMGCAAIIEKRRLQIALNFGLIDMPKEIVPMSMWWLIPQYALLGLADVFIVVGLQEFFYHQVPDGLRSVGLSLFFSMFGLGSFLSGFLISVIEKVTSGNGRYGWFSNNLNRAHLDYFYWLLAGLSVVEFFMFLYFSKSYVYKREA